jgi:predicted urease superfamily metal-dependent hydrolase
MFSFCQMLKDFSNLLVARITKKEILLNNPSMLREFEAGGKRFYVLKEEFFHLLKNVLAQRIMQRAYEQKYYIYSEIVYRETADALYAVALVHPRWIGKLKWLLRLPSITPEEFQKKAIEKINEYEFKPVYVEEFKEYQNAKQI